MEKELVRQLGEKIGYGNMMQLASECWEEYMLTKGYPTSGVFVSALKCDLCKHQKYIGIYGKPCVSPEPCLGETGKKNWKRRGE
jgi:hypothetical protein